MRIPDDAIIAPEKIRDYLLVHQDRSDKSEFLAVAGFTRSNWRELEAAIRALAASQDARRSASTSYGNKWIVDGIITGPNGRTRPVRLVWLQEQNGSFRFVT